MEIPTILMGIYQKQKSMAILVYQRVVMMSPRIPGTGASHLGSCGTELAAVGATGDLE